MIAPAAIELLLKRSTQLVSGAACGGGILRPVPRDGAAVLASIKGKGLRPALRAAGTEGWLRRGRTEGWRWAVADQAACAPDTSAPPTERQCELRCSLGT